jgi:prevent-host-death family protein
MSKNNVWEIQEAEKHFLKLIENAQNEGMQTIKKEGVEIAVLLSIEDFDNCCCSKNSLIDFFKNSPFPDLDLDIERLKN